MSNNTVWPPKPDLPDPLTEYDDLIKEKLTARPMGLPGLGMFNLIKALRDRGMNLGQAFAAIDNYSARQRALLDDKAKSAMTASLVAALTGIGMAFTAVLLILYHLYLMFHRGAILGQPHHQAALLALDQKMATVQTVAFVILILSLSLTACHYWVVRHRKSRNE